MKKILLHNYYFALLKHSSLPLARISIKLISFALIVNHHSCFMLYHSHSTQNTTECNTLNNYINDKYYIISQAHILNSCELTLEYMFELIYHQNSIRFNSFQKRAIQLIRFIILTFHRLRKLNSKKCISILIEPLNK